MRLTNTQTFNLLMQMNETNKNGVLKRKSQNEGGRVSF